MRAQTYSSRRFTQSEGKLATFKSDLDLRAHETFGTIYTDAIDQGLFIRSARTDKIAAFSLKQEHFDDDGDITHWEFTPVAPHVSLWYPPGEVAPWVDYQNITVIVYNT